MSTFKARGMVIKEAFKGESDKVLTLFCKGIGKTTVYARGAKKTKSKYLAGSQLFTYSDFIIYNGGTFQSVTQIDIIQSFYNVREDYERFCCGSHMLKLLNKVLYPDMPCDELLLLILRALTALSSEKASPGLARSIFELKLLEHEGFMPELNACSICGMDSFKPVFFSADGLLCGDCLNNKPAIKTSDTAFYAIKRILSASPPELFGFGASDELCGELQRICNLFMISHLGNVD